MQRWQRLRVSRSWQQIEIAPNYETHTIRRHLCTHRHPAAVHPRPPFTHTHTVCRPKQNKNPPHHLHPVTTKPTKILIA